MLLIADSGSTKTDWRVVNEDGKTVTSINTKGLNPYFLTEKEISQIIKEHVLPKIEHIDKVFFYGAGCGLPVKAEQVKNAIDANINARFSAEVAGDILGAARSMLQDKPGITCILGTGANSCVYDGQQITDNVPSLGFILADWGSGTVMCKDLLSLLLQEKLSDEITADFTDTYKLDRRQILDNIYNKPMANRFLASFTPFLLKHADDFHCREIILNNFRNFFSYYVLRYGLDKSELKVGITGSVAYHFKAFLMEIAGEMGIAIEKIIQHPMEGLVRYHALTAPVLR